MEKWVVLFFILFSLKALSQDIYAWVNIDCGSDNSYKTIEGIQWQTDDEFIQTGTNKQVSPDAFTTLEQMNSLRVFTQQNKNCYVLPSTSMDRYFISAMFKYGNYDGLSIPPTFDLQIDGNKIKTIETSVNNITNFEVIYTSRGDNINVCLARIKDKEYPFISSLEALPLGDNMYAGMNRDLAWVLSYRYNYGNQDWMIGGPGETDYETSDEVNRMWELALPQDLNSVIADTATLHYKAYEHPPWWVIFDATEAQTSNDSITLSFADSKPSSLNYILMYFTEMTQLAVNVTRSFDVYVDGVFVLNSTPEYQNCTKVETYAHAEGNITVELRPTTESNLPPIISAIEVYMASDALVTTGTSQDDLKGLGVIISAFFEKLKGWSGEPCLPIDSTWQWLGCAGNDPPQVTSLNLSAYGLDGPLPNFSQMQGLESIDLSSNNLDGSIPDFLGKLPNLKILNLRGNNFSGKIPHSIASNKNIKLSVDGNLNQPEIPPKSPANNTGKKVGHIIGIILGIVVVMLVNAGILYFLYRKKLQPGAPVGLHGGQQPTNPESGPQNPQEDVSVSINASMDLIHSGPQQNGNNRPRPEGGNFTVGNCNCEQNLNGGYFPVQGGAGKASMITHPWFQRLIWMCLISWFTLEARGVLGDRA